MRGTLRELYGYVALLAGRDRREAERHVADVYRSLHRAALAGQVDAVTLGALRSAARRTWLEAHLVELATVDEVSRASASTIADLSTLERAVLVLRHVNGMSVERTASEIGRSDREIAAVGAHAVRRLRGTDDTSGAWLRAYLGPTVTPTAGLVDRIVAQLGEVAGPSGAATDGAGTGESDTDETDSAEADSAEADSADAAPVVGTDDVTGPVDQPDLSVEPGTETEVEDPATTELPIVERPTLELAVVPGAAARPDDPVAAAPPFEPLAPLDAPPDDEPTARPRWIVAIGLALVAALVVALVWLALRGDTDDTVVSAPSGGSEPADATLPDGDATASTDPSTTTAPSTVSSTASSTTVVLGPVEVGFDPPCTERSGTEPATVSWADAFGPLGEAPALTVSLPESVDVAADPERVSPRVETILRPDGLVLAVQPAPEHRVTQTLLARVGVDGTVAWIRCLDGSVEIGTAPDAGVELATRPVDGEWTTRSLADGVAGEPVDPVQSAVLDGSLDAGGADGGGDVTLGYSYDSASGRSVLAGLDDGRVVWRAPDLELPTGDAFRATAVGDTAVALHCPPAEPATSEPDTSEPDTSGPATREAGECATGELRGYDLTSGELRWTRPGLYRVAATADGFALVGDATAWELVTVADGVTVDGQRWGDPDAFVVPGDGDDDVTRAGGAIVVRRPGTVALWLPADVSGEPVRATVP